MFIADLHIHSRYSRATSQACEPIQLDYWARRKGLDLIASGDFTHAQYRDELRQRQPDQGLGAVGSEPRHPAQETQAVRPSLISGALRWNGASCFPRSCRSQPVAPRKCL